MDVDTHLGPEMKSTGEVLGIASTREEALYKGMIAAGWKMIKPEGGEGLPLAPASSASPAVASATPSPRGDATSCLPP